MEHRTEPLACLALVRSLSVLCELLKTPPYRDSAGLSFGFAGSAPPSATPAELSSPRRKLQRSWQ